MAVKTPFTPDDFVTILAQYGLGDFVRSDPMQAGTVQTNYFLQTTQGKLVFRYYENRSQDMVLFERDLLTFLAERRYPCPAPFVNRQGTTVGLYRNKPYMISPWIEGRHIEHPSAHHRQQIIQRVAELQKLTRQFHSAYTGCRWNYTPDLCRALAWEETSKIGTQDAYQKFAWLAHELSTLHLPPALPRAICHGDFHFSNLLFADDEFVALLDFDDANFTFALFDLVGLIEAWAWPSEADMLDVPRARAIVQAYADYRPLSSIEQECLYDVYKLSILIDCVWFFGRGAADDFYEKRKIDALTNLGRQRLRAELFQTDDARREHETSSQPALEK